MFGTVDTPGFAVPINHKRDRWLEAEPDTRWLTLWEHCHMWRTHICMRMAHTVTVTISLRDRTTRTLQTSAKLVHLPLGSLRAVAHCIPQFLRHPGFKPRIRHKDAFISTEAWAKGAGNTC